MSSHPDKYKLKSMDDLGKSKLKQALIGHTGFVGSHLAEQMPFTHFYNSQNIQEIQNQKFDLLVCSGVSAIKWLANKEPTQDWKQIEILLKNLSSVQAQHFVLISTIDVYPEPRNVDEKTQPNQDKNHAYGRHRLQIEDFVKKNFSSYSIVRLPALFGNRLKKNIIFDLLNKNGLPSIQPLSSFQYYDLKNIGADLKKIYDHKISLINITSEPLSTQQILLDHFPHLEVGSQPSQEAHYDVKSIHSKLWNSKDEYQYTKSQIIKSLKEFVSTYKVKHGN